MRYPKKTVHKSNSDYTFVACDGSSNAGPVFINKTNKLSTKWGRVTCKQCLKHKQTRIHYILKHS